MSVVFLVIGCAMNLALLVYGWWRPNWPRSPLRCALFGHQIEVLQYFEDHARRIVCHRCDGCWVHKMSGEFAGVCLRWDDDFAELYESMGYPIRRWPNPGAKTPYRSRW